MTVDELTRLGYTKIRLPEWGPLQYLLVYEAFGGLNAVCSLFGPHQLDPFLLDSHDWLPVGEPEKSC